MWRPSDKVKRLYGCVLCRATLLRREFWSLTARIERNSVVTPDKRIIVEGGDVFGEGVKRGGAPRKPRRQPAAHLLRKPYDLTKKPNYLTYILHQVGSFATLAAGRSFTE
jgi:hypothetical protein